ncbi:hypothetical protein M011DRAFT_482058 [Sporormia fimetaria CBS 119925]|uniref:Uncharacterized protein n=1 Tax=Sporormia fimetaria CBS 119925 TaxID=1340428 RepID=A0A6A6UUL8_9PLEO|nr:hypothetical protein M011DRAFT_482058 [Sporormia fimetaria CBS 119925]
MRVLHHLVTPLLSCVALCQARAELSLHDCEGKLPLAGCLRPLKTPVALGPTSYLAVVPCLDCAVAGHYTSSGEGKEPGKLLYNVTLSHDQSSVLLNGETIYPVHWESYEQPPHIVVSEVAEDFHHVDVVKAVECGQHACGHCAECIEKALATIVLDYDYGIKEIEHEPGSTMYQYALTFDAIGGSDGIQGRPLLAYSHPQQPMLRIALEATFKQQRATSDMQAASTLFDPLPEEQEPSYKLRMLHVELAPRTHKFISPPSRNAWVKLKYYLGYDPEAIPGHIIFRQLEWNHYGKTGTLRSQIKRVLETWPWEAVGLTVAGVAASLLLLYGAFRLLLFILEQRRLAQWSGMEGVWRRMREEGDEEDRLLSHSSTEDLGDNRPPPYTDDVPVREPLTSKPLPEKPLPPLPLLDEA